MALAPMAQGGQWLRPSHDAPPVYLAPKQHEAHFKRLVGDGWIPCDDPRREEDQQSVVPPVPASNEIALQARIDQLEALVQHMIQKVGEHGTSNDGNPDNASSAPDSRSKRGRSDIHRRSDSEQTG